MDIYLKKNENLTIINEGILKVTDAIKIILGDGKLPDWEQLTLDK